MQEVFSVKITNLTKIYKIYDSSLKRILNAFCKRVKYKEFHAIKDVSVTIPCGEVVGIVGKNGHGKSTLLKLITGVTKQTEGEIKTNGRIVAMLELTSGFDKELTGLENIYIKARTIGMSKAEIEKRMQDICDFADIGDFVHQPVKTYSSGMFVRLAFAVAINIDPEILIVDEALSVGDVFFQAKCYHKFEEFKKMGKTILFVSHDLTSIAKYCDRVILLNKGVKLAEGNPKDMVNMYKKLLVHQLDEET